MLENYEDVMEYIDLGGLKALVNVCREIACELKFDICQTKRKMKTLPADCRMRTEPLEKFLDDARDATDLLRDIFARLEVVGVLCRKDGEETPLEIMVMNAGREKS